MSIRQLCILKQRELNSLVLSDQSGLIFAKFKFAKLRQLWGKNWVQYCLSGTPYFVCSTYINIKFDKYVKAKLRSFSSKYLCYDCTYTQIRFLFRSNSPQIAEHIFYTIIFHMHKTVTSEKLYR